MILRESVAFSTAWFEVVERQVQTTGFEGNYYTLKQPDYVCIIALTLENKLVLVRQYRPSVDGFTIELPAGRVDPGESAQECVVRELFEETAYRAIEVTDLGSLLPDTGRLANRMWCFFATVEPVKGAIVEEGLEVVLASSEELAQLILNGSFNHALHMAPLVIAMLRGKLPEFRAT